MFNWFLRRALKQFNGEKNSLFNKHYWNNWVFTHRKMKLNLYLLPHTENNWKWIKDLNIKASYKPKRKHRNKSLLLGLSNGFLDTPPKAQETKGKIDKLDFIKIIKHFYASKDIIKKVKRQYTEWEQIFADHVSDERLCPECIKNSWIGISPKKTHKWLLSTWKDAQLLYSWEKCK